MGILGMISPGVKQSGHEADNAPPSGAKVTNGGAVPLLLDMTTWHSA
jgi:hypothetical protein